MFTEEDLLKAGDRASLLKIAEERGIELRKPLRTINYLEELALLQAEMVSLQQWIAKKKLRVAIILEGRDAAGKGGAIKRYVEHLNPRQMRVVALAKPTEIEKGQWYFRRYIKELPRPGEIVFFDRSWYNRAVVEPVMGFCKSKEYDQFIEQVSEFEHMLYEDGVVLIKFWFSISKKEQKKRFSARINNPLKKWKFSSVDEKGQELWKTYTLYKDAMFAKTHTNFSPWMIVKANNKKTARLETMRFILSKFDYEGKKKTPMSVQRDPNIVSAYFRLMEQIDQ